MGGLETAEPSWSFRRLAEETSAFCAFSSFFFWRLRSACDRAGASSSGSPRSESLVSSESLGASTSNCLFRFGIFLGTGELKGPSESEELDVEAEEDMIIGDVVGIRKLIEIGLPN